MAERNNSLHTRFAASRVETALSDTPVVLVNGPRQCGKTTLVRNLIGGNREYYTLDDATVLESARTDPDGFVRRLGSAVIDEVQRAPELLIALKKAVDEDRRPGRFLLTGSANVLTLPRVAESLAGRMEVITLQPLSQAELLGKAPGFLSNAFQGQPTTPVSLLSREALMEAVLTGGYPEMLERRDAERRRSWARNYIKAIVDRDARDIADLEKLDRMPRLLRALAEHSGQLTNYAQLGGQLGLDGKTANKYIGVLEQLFLITRIEPWFRNRLSRLVKTPKLHFLDSGLLASLSGATYETLENDRTRFGALLETFVLAEVVRQITWQSDMYSLYHYRDKDQNEVDIVIENEMGDVVGLEIKAAATVRASDFKGLRRLAESAGSDFKFGAVLYDGDAILPFGDGLYAAPISSLWG